METIKIKYSDYDGKLSITRLAEEIVMSGDCMGDFCGSIWNNMDYPYMVCQVDRGIYKFICLNSGNRNSDIPVTTNTLKNMDFIAKNYSEFVELLKKGKK